MKKKTKKILVIMMLLLGGCSFFADDDTNSIEQINDTQVGQAYESNQNEQTEDLIKNSTFSIHFIDVGQADAALVECDGHYMLIDGGNREDSDLIYTVLKNKNISHLDIVVGTHPHEDHIGGIAGAFNFADADLTLCSTDSYDSEVFNNFKKYADEKGNGIVIPNIKDTYLLGSAVIDIIGVNTDTDNTNNTSIVLMITYGETKFLFTGDIEKETEKILTEAGTDLSATVLKVGHHGSNTSSSYSFLREIMPQYAIISVGSDNPYEHPNGDTLSKLRDADVQVYRTDLQGDIQCTSDGKTVHFSVEKNENIDTLASVRQSEQTQEITNADTEKIPDNYDYILNTNSEKFHSPDCSSASKISNDNKEYYTGSAEELIELGYSPCEICKPYHVIEATPTPTPTPKPTVKPTSTPSETLVWIPNSGSKYHKNSSCSNMKNPTQVTKSEAESWGYTPCKKCYR